MKRNVKMVWNVPNILTLIRLLLIPVFVLFMAQNRMTAALIVYVSASLTDLVDGYIARKFNQITDFGKLMDPLADKLMILSLMIGMLLKGIVPVAAIVLVILKDVLLIAGGVFLLKRKKVVYSMALGKVAQFIIVVALIMCFFHERFTAIGLPLHLILLWVGIVLSMAALFQYARRNMSEYIPFLRQKSDHIAG